MTATTETTAKIIDYIDVNFTSTDYFSGMREGYEALDEQGRLVRLNEAQSIANFCTALREQLAARYPDAEVYVRTTSERDHVYAHGTGLENDDEQDVEDLVDYLGERMWNDSATWMVYDLVAAEEDED